MAEKENHNHLLSFDKGKNQQGEPKKSCYEMILEEEDIEAESYKTVKEKTEGYQAELLDAIEGDLESEQEDAIVQENTMKEEEDWEENDDVHYMDDLLINDDLLGEDLMMEDQQDSIHESPSPMEEDERDTQQHGKGKKDDEEKNCGGVDGTEGHPIGQAEIHRSELTATSKKKTQLNHAMVGFRTKYAYGKGPIISKTQTKRKIWWAGPNSTSTPGVTHPPQ